MSPLLMLLLAGTADVPPKRLADLEAELAKLGAALQAKIPPYLPADVIARRMPDGVVLIDYSAIRGSVLAFVLQRGRPMQRIGLGPLAPIEKEIEAWRTALIAGKGHDPARLRALIWDPLAKHLDGAKVVLISPDGPLHRLPFAALPGKKKGTYLIEDVTLAVVPGAWAIHAVPRRFAAKPSLLVVGDVDFGKSARGAPKWASLPETAAEIKAAAAAFGERGPVVSLTGAKATKVAVLAALMRTRFAHVATHGFFTPDVKPDPKAEGVGGWHPGLLSGIALAGANAPTEKEDGVLTALDVAAKDVSNLELAILSVGETALGKEAAGEGMLGLARAFHVAGCRSVVASLWSPDDGATRVLMGRFHHHLWIGKLPKAEALRQAQLAFIRAPSLSKKGAKTPPPAWWALWQLSGDWR